MKHILMFALLFVLFACEKDEDNKPPIMVSSSPGNLAENVSIATSKVSITFNEPVFLNDAHGIVINDQSVNPSVNGNILEFEVQLKPRTHYKVKIPDNAVRDASGNMSRIYVIQFTTETVVAITESLSIPSPSAQAVKLYDYLRDIYGKKSLSSTMAMVDWNTEEAEWLYNHTGKYPAMNGFDLIFLHVSPTNWINYEDVSPVEEWWNNNGIVSLCWHWNVPKTPGSSEHTFRVEQTTFDIANALVDGTWENEIVKADVAEVIGILKRLQAKNIPVLWRPLHEASGGWFWWGKDKKPEPCKVLWRWMYDYFKDEGINNLIWVWTVDVDPTKNKSDIDWYPGDEYVDMIGLDVYNQTDVTVLADRFKAAQLEYPTKMITMSECGKTARISDVWDAGAKWSYFMPWYDTGKTGAGEDHNWADISWWKAALNHEAVLTRDEVPDLK
jgi:mannan endo-1,4-beta-mannosidase